MVHDIARGGSGVAKLETGEVVFVPFTAVGDEVKIRITKKTKNYSQGEIETLLSPSSSRVTPPCPAFTQCGGCTWQHLPYEQQFEIKKKGLVHTLNKAGIPTQALPLDLMPAPQPYHYRNRIQLHGDREKNAFGFFEKATHRITSIDRCDLADPRINEALPQLKKQGFAENSQAFKLEVELDESGKLLTAWNQKHAAFGFRQVNDAQNQVLQSWVKKQIGTGSHLFDFYGGKGNLSLGLIHQFSEIRCVDTHVPKLNSRQIPQNYFYHSSSVLNWLKGFDLQVNSSVNPTETSAIFDPPREGVGQDLQAILSLLKFFKLKRILLVGCDVDSFTKDSLKITQAGYSLSRLGVLDLFPQTPHVESLALFTQ